MRLEVEDLVLEAIAAFERGNWSEGLRGLSVIKSDIENRIDEHYYRWAKTMVERHHGNMVDRIADEVAREWREGEFNGSRESMMESLEQSCDTACTYRYEAQFLLTASNNDDAYNEISGQQVPWEAMATCALRTDVIEELGRRDVDVNTRPPREAVVECAACGAWTPKATVGCESCGDGDPSEPEEAPNASRRDP